jgi:hypothetical protein
LKERLRRKTDLVSALEPQCQVTKGEMATTSKEGSRRANYPILTQGGSDNK